MILNVFSNSGSCPFILLMVSFTAQKHFSWMWFHLFIFTFVAVAFGVRLKKKILPGVIARSFPAMFCSRSFAGLGLYIHVFNPLWANFCVWCEIFAQFCSSACGCPVFPIPFIEGIVLSLLYILASFVVN